MRARVKTSVHVGRSGEELAADYLKARGFSVLARNQRTPLGELDLVCREAGSIVFVEVKSRSTVVYGDGLEAIDATKVRRLRAAAAWWLADKQLRPVSVRFDAVIVSLGGGVPVSLRHIVDLMGLGA